MAMQAIDLDQFGSNRSAAAAFKVAKNMLDGRCKGVPARRNCTPNSKNLTGLEEQVIVDHTLDLNTRGFQLMYDLLREMADKMLGSILISQLTSRPSA